MIDITPRSDGEVHLLTPVEGVAHEDSLIARATCPPMKTAPESNRLPKGSGVDISIDKCLPMGSDLDGGSSNTATVLVTLNHLWQRELSVDELATPGLTLGADIPVFVHGRVTFTEGVDEILTPVEPEEEWYPIAYPRVSIPAPVIFNNPGLPHNTPERSIKILLKCEFGNGYGVIARKRLRKVDAMSPWLLECAPSCLTDTGAYVFAEFDTESRVHRILGQTPKWLKGFMAKDVNLSPLHRALL